MSINNHSLDMVSHIKLFHCFNFQLINSNTCPDYSKAVTLPGKTQLHIIMLSITNRSLWSGVEVFRGLVEDGLDGPLVTEGLDSVLIFGKTYLRLSRIGG